MEGHLLFAVDGEQEQGETIYSGSRSSPELLWVREEVSEEEKREEVSEEEKREEVSEEEKRRSEERQMTEVRTFEDASQCDLSNQLSRCLQSNGHNGNHAQAIVMHRDYFPPNGWGDASGTAQSRS